MNFDDPELSNGNPFHRLCFEICGAPQEELRWIGGTPGTPCTPSFLGFYNRPKKRENNGVFEVIYLGKGVDLGCIFLGAGLFNH